MVSLTIYVEFFQASDLVLPPRDYLSVTVSANADSTPTETVVYNAFSTFYGVGLSTNTSLQYAVTVSLPPSYGFVVNGNMISAEGTATQMTWNYTSNSFMCATRLL